MNERQFDTMDLLSIFSVMLGYENLMENRQQSAQNDVQSANDKQATFLLNEIYKKFDEQNEKIDKILSLLEVKEE